MKTQAAPTERETNFLPLTKFLTAAIRQRPLNERYRDKRQPPATAIYITAISGLQSRSDMWLQPFAHGYARLRTTWAHGCARVHCIASNSYAHLRTVGCNCVPEMGTSQNVGAGSIYVEEHKTPGHFQAKITMLAPHQAKRHTTNPSKYPPVNNKVPEGRSNQPYRWQS